MSRQYAQSRPQNFDRKTLPHTSPHAGWAEQDADYFWSSLCEACQGLWLKLGFPKEEIVAVSVTTQRGTVVAMDKTNRPIGPAISWLDQRRVETKPALGSLESLIMRVIGAKDAVDNFHREAEANWLAQNLPEQWQKVLITFWLPLVQTHWKL
jgi:sugar (pentulose or hexulose) kinase